MITFARANTASQLAKVVASYRAVDGTAKQRRSRQRVSWVIQDDGSVHITAVLPPEEGAAVVAAIQTATDANRTEQPESGEEQPPETETADEVRERTKVEGLVEVANHYLDPRPEDRSGEDRTLVVVEVNAAALAAEPVPAGTSKPAALPIEQTCRVRGGGAVERSTARRAACDAPALGMIIDDLGKPLAIGREQRLVTRAQRRALMIRDQGRCQFPGCAQARHLKAHHRISWLDGGPTDVDNLILLCQWHHTRVHEEDIMIRSCTDPDCTTRWRFTRPDGTDLHPVIVGLDARSPWRPLLDSENRPLAGPSREAARVRNDERVARYEAEQTELRAVQEEARARYSHIDHTDHPDARRVFPVGGGEGFRLADCVDALFQIAPPADSPAQAA